MFKGHPEEEHLSQWAVETFSASSCFHENLCLYTKLLTTKERGL